MEIPKHQILQMLRDRGADGKAQLVEQQLPDQVDLDEHARRLQIIGINRKEIIRANVQPPRSERRDGTPR